MLSSAETSESLKHLVMVASVDTVAGHNYEWLPSPMPPGIRVLFSAVEKEAIIRGRQRRTLPPASAPVSVSSSDKPRFVCKECGRLAQDQGQYRLLLLQISLLDFWGQE